VRRDLLDHVIVLNQRHLRRLLKEYVGYYHEGRTHLGLGEGHARRSELQLRGPRAGTRSSPYHDSEDHRAFSQALA
jgi:hypothetical protein